MANHCLSQRGRLESGGQAKQNNSKAHSQLLSGLKVVDMETAIKLFFSSPRFAVAGASQDQKKFGYKGLLLFAKTLKDLADDNKHEQSWSGTMLTA